jgi:hypothetical protein
MGFGVDIGGSLGFGQSFGFGGFNGVGAGSLAPGLDGANADPGALGSAFDLDTYLKNGGSLEQLVQENRGQLGNLFSLEQLAASPDLVRLVNFDYLNSDIGKSYLDSGAFGDPTAAVLRNLFLPGSSSPFAQQQTQQGGQSMPLSGLTEVQGNFGGGPLVPPSPFSNIQQVSNPLPPIFSFSGGGGGLSGGLVPILDQTFGEVQQRQNQATSGASAASNPALLSLLGGGGAGGGGADDFLFPGGSGGGGSSGGGLGGVLDTILDGLGGVLSGGGDALGGLLGTLFGGGGGGGGGGAPGGNLGLLGALLGLGAGAFGDDTTTQKTRVPGLSLDELQLLGINKELAMRQLQAFRDQQGLQQSQNSFLGTLFDDLRRQQAARNFFIDPETRALDEAGRRGVLQSLNVNDLLLGQGLQQDINSGGRATPDQLANIQGAADSAISAGLSDLTRFRDEGLNQVRLNSAARGLRPNDTPIANQFADVSQEANRQAQNFVTGIRGQQFQQNLNFPLQAQGLRLGQFNTALDNSFRRRALEEELSRLAESQRFGLGSQVTQAGLGLTPGGNAALGTAQQLGGRLTGNVTTTNSGSQLDQLLRAGSGLGALGGLLGG